MNCIGCEKELAPFGATYFPEYPENPLCHSCTAARFGIDDEETKLIPQMTKPIDLAADEEWEIFREATERLKEPHLE